MVVESRGRAGVCVRVQFSRFDLHGNGEVVACAVDDGTAVSQLSDRLGLISTPKDVVVRVSFGNLLDLFQYAPGFQFDTPRSGYPGYLRHGLTEAGLKVWV